MPVRRHRRAVEHSNRRANLFLLYHLRAHLEQASNARDAGEAEAETVGDQPVDWGCVVTARKRKALERQIARASGVGPSCVVVYERESRRPRIRVTMPPIQVSAEMRDYWLTQGIKI
jgi:hypothetical protein